MGLAFRKGCFRLHHYQKQRTRKVTVRKLQLRPQIKHGLNTEFNNPCFIRVSSVALIAESLSAQHRQQMAHSSSTSPSPTVSAIRARINSR